MITAPNLAAIHGLIHGFGLRDSTYPPGMITVGQTHSDTVVEASANDAPAEGDALISNQPGIVVGIKTADCVPILLADPVARAVAAVHAGWRGTAAHIVERAVEAMAAKWRTKPQDVRAAIGPSIGPCCYEVGPDVARQFGIEGTGKTQLALALENQKQLHAAGVEDIWRSGECTFCAPARFHSWRRDQQKEGRMLSFIGILEPSG